MNADSHLLAPAVAPVAAPISSLTAWTYTCCRAWPVLVSAPVGLCGYCNEIPRLVLPTF